MGIVFHTSYSGKTMDKLSASFGAVRGSSNRNVFLASAGYKETALCFLNQSCQDLTHRLEWLKVL